MMGMRERIFSQLPRDVSLEVLVPEFNFDRRLGEGFDLSFVKGPVEDHANPSLLSPTRLPTPEVASELYSLPKDGCLPRWRVPSTTIGFSAQSPTKNQTRLV